MTIRKQKTASSKLRVTILGAAVAVAAFGVGGSKGYAQEPVGASANFDINVNDLVATIQQAVNSAADRPGVVKQMNETTYNKVNQQYNVMVFNLNQNYDASQLIGVKFYQPFAYSGIQFGVWVFESGTFVNQGDGGFINWAFNGSWTRTGQDSKTVVFTKRPNAPSAPPPPPPTSPQPRPSRPSSPQPSSSQPSSSQSGMGKQGGHGNSAAPKASKPKSGARPQNGTARPGQAPRPRPSSQQTPAAAHGHTGGVKHPHP